MKRLVIIKLTRSVILYLIVYHRFIPMNRINRLFSCQASLQIFCSKIAIENWHVSNNLQKHAKQSFVCVDNTMRDNEQ